MPLAAELIADVARTSAPAVLAWAKKECDDENYPLAFSIVSFFTAFLCAVAGLANPLFRIVSLVLFFAGLASAALHMRRTGHLGLTWKTLPAAQ